MTESKVVRVAAIVASLIGACATVAAYGQENTGTNAVSKSANSENISANGGAAVLQQIVVTAEHLRENLQNAPIAITAVSPQQIRVLNLRSIQDLQLTATDLTYAQGLEYQLPSIRGIGSWLTNPGLEPAVATYIDGSYVERAFGAMYDLVDVAGVQVLKGPQGTLYGRNATGGAIVITTANPTFQFGGHVSAEVGSLDHRKLDVVLNTPLSNTVSNRIAARYEGNGGWVRNLNTGTRLGASELLTLRDKIAYKPENSPFSALFEYEYDKFSHTEDPNTETLPAVFCAFCGLSKYTYPIANPYTTAVNIVQGGKWGADNTHFYDLQMNYDTDLFSLKNIAAYRTITSYAPGDLDFTEVSGFNIYQNSGAHTFTDDVTFSTKLNGPVNVIAGLDYLKDSSYMKLWISNLDYNAPSTLVQSIERPTISYSGFAEVMARPVSKLTITAGVRYTHDKREWDTGTSIGFNSVTPRFVIAYNFGPTNVYLSYNKGFKAGGYNTSVTSTFKPEKIDSYEAGLKYLSSDHRLRANLAVFTYKYSDIQVLAVNQANVANIGTQNNAASATGSGLELEGQYAPISGTELFGGMSWLDAHFDSFPNAQVQVPLYNSAGQPIGFGVGSENLSHTPLARAPRWTGNIGVTEKFPVGKWRGEATLAMHYTSGYYFQAGAGGPLKADRQGGYTTGVLTARLYPEGSNYQLNFYVNNITNAVYDNFRFSTAPFGALQDVAPPRTYGMGVTVLF